MKSPFVAKAIATFFGLGFIPLAPGTAASLAALPILGPFRSDPAIILPFLGALGVLAVWSCGRYARQLMQKDPQSAVIDEVFGMGLALAALPDSGWRGMLAAFVFFRAFDVIKPFPLKKLEALPGGWGILADDAGAAIYTIMTLKAWAALF